MVLNMKEVTYLKTEVNIWRFKAALTRHLRRRTHAEARISIICAANTVHVNIYKDKEFNQLLK